MFYIPASFCKTYFGDNFIIAGDGTVTYGGKTLKSFLSDNVPYVNAVDLCNQLGLGYFEDTSRNLFIILASDSAIDTNTDSKYLDRLIGFLKDSSYEPTVTIEKTRSVVSYSDPSTNLYLWSPSIVKYNGVIYVSNDVSCKYTQVSVSRDNGKTWENAGKVDGMWWATIFENGGKLYLIGRIKEVGGELIGISMSTDGGKTWSEITPQQGIIHYNSSSVHCARRRL